MQCEPPELVYVQRAMSVILDNRVEDDQAAECFEGLDEMSPRLINGPHSQTDFNPIIQFLADHVGGALDRGVTRRTDEGKRASVAEFGQVVLVPPLPALIEINRLQKIAARRDIRSSTGPEVGDRKLLLRRFGQEQVSDGDMGEVGDGLDLGESGPLLLGQPPVPVREPAAHVIIIAASTALRPLQYAGSYDGAHADPLRCAS